MNTFGHCPHCGYEHSLLVMCPRIKAMDYHLDGSLKRIEYFDQPSIGPLKTVLSWPEEKLQ